MSISGLGNAQHVSAVTSRSGDQVRNDPTFEGMSEEISALIKLYQEHPRDGKNISKQALELIKKITDEKFNDGKIETVRCLLCSLLELDIPQVHNEITRKLIENYLDTPTAYFNDFQHKWIMSIIELERHMSRLINLYIRGGDLNNVALRKLVLTFSEAYVLLLLRLVLFSFLESENKQLVCLHLQTIESEAQPWLCLLQKEGQCDKLFASKADEIRSALEIIHKPHHIHEMEKLLNEMCGADRPLKFLIPLGDLCAYMGLWGRADSYYQRVLDSVDINNDKAISFKTALLKRLSKVCFLMNNYQFLTVLTEKIHILDPNSSGDYFPFIVLEIINNGQYLVASRMIRAALNRARQDRNEKMEACFIALQGAVNKSLGKCEQAYDSSFDAAVSAMTSATSRGFTSLFLEPMKLEALRSDNPELGGVFLDLEKAAENLADGRQSKASREEPPEIRAQRLMSQRNYTEAADLFEKCLESKKQENPRIAEDDLISLYVVCCARIRDYKKAKLCLKNHLPLWKEQREIHMYARACVQLGELCAYLSHDQEAIDYFRESLLFYAPLQESLEQEKEYSISFFDERANALVGLQSILLKQKRWDEALVCCDQRKAPVLVNHIAKRISPYKTYGMPSTALTFEQIQALAKEHNTVFVSYAFTLDLTSASYPTKLDRQLYVYVIAPQGQLECRMLKYDDLPEELKNPELLFKTFPYAKPEGEGFLKKCRERFERFYEALIAPIEDLLPADSLQSITIVPEGVLAHIPFGALKDKNGEYLIEKHPFVYTPSIQALQLLSQIPAQFPDCSLVVYNPETPISGINNLQPTENEVQKCVIPYLKKKPIITLSQSSSTVARVLEELPKVRWAYLACHAEAEGKEDQYSEFDSLFRLAKDDNHPDGCLYAKTIASLHLNAELVFMSACHSGRGKLKQEGTIGLNWSFLAAGALSTVATHWPLTVTNISNEMIEIFYKHLFGVGVEKMGSARALQQAMIHGLKRSPRDPRQWAVFFLSGIDRKVNENK